MKIGFIIKSLEGEGGGAERVLVAVVNALAERGHEISVLTFDRPDFSPFYPLGASVKRIGLNRKANLHSVKLSDFLPMMCAVRKEFGRDFDVVVGFMHSAYIPAALGLVGTGIPFISSEHASAAHLETRHMQRALAGVARHLSYAKTVVSDVIRGEHPPSERDNIVVLPNPVKMADFWPAQNVKPEKTILCIGGLRPEKGQDVLIRAFEKIAGNHSDWRLRLIGDGITRPTIERLVAKSRYRDRIELAGVKRDIPAELSRGAFVVVPSLHESLALVAVESMASGRPVIGFADCAGPAKLVDHGKNGLLVVPSQDRAAALAQAIDLLIKDADLRREMGAHAPSTVSTFSEQKVIDQWEELLKSASQHAPIPLDMEP